MDVAKAGLNALLTPEESVLLLIDHQAFQFANLNSHDPTIIVNNVIGLAKVTKAFGVPGAAGTSLRACRMCFRTINPSTGRLSTPGRTTGW